MVLSLLFLIFDMSLLRRIVLMCTVYGPALIMNCGFIIILDASVEVKIRLTYMLSEMP